VATGQIGLGDLVHVDVDGIRNRLIFSKSSGGALIHDNMPQADATEVSSESFSGGVGLPIPAASKAAKKGQGRGEKSDTSNN
jgi:hypothetical protein